MPIFRQNQSPLWSIWKIDETCEELLRFSERANEYMPILERFTSEHRKKEWLAVRLLLKHLLGVEATIAYYETGVPYLPDFPCSISISHTKGYAAVIVGKDAPVGIDIEYQSERVHRIKTRFMNETELAGLGNLCTEQLLACWSAKETAFKMMRQRVVDLQTHLHVVSIDSMGNRGRLLIKETYTPEQTTYPINYEITPEFVLTCSG